MIAWLMPVVLAKKALVRWPPRSTRRRLRRHVLRSSEGLAAT